MEQNRDAIEVVRGAQDEDMTMSKEFLKALKFNPNHDAQGRFASGMPEGTEGKNAQPDVQGPRSGEGKGTSANRGSDPVPMTGAPSTSVAGQDAGGTRSGDNKALPNSGSAPSGSVSGPRSGENKATPAVAQQNDSLQGGSAPSGQDAGGTRTGDNKSTPDNGLPPGTAPTAGGPRSGENKATDGFNQSGTTTTTQGDQSHVDSSQPKNTAPAAVFANDVKRGTRVRLRNGWEARLEDNKKGNTRLATVYGDYTEMGSVYTKDITHAQVGGKWTKVQMSPAQEKTARKIRAMGF